MNVIEELNQEASDRAGSVEGLFRLIKLLILEADNLPPLSTPLGAKQYTALLHAYVLAKRQLGKFKKVSEFEEIPETVYADTIQRLRYTLKVKREEAMKRSVDLPMEKVKEINRIVGRYTYSIVNPTTQTFTR